jgi:hypothetical protein
VAKKNARLKRFLAIAPSSDELSARLKPQARFDLTDNLYQSDREYNSTSAAPYTAAETSSMVTVGSVLVEYVVSLGVSTPAGAAGVVGPKPVPHRMIVSPGLAGTSSHPRTFRSSRPS